MTDPEADLRVVVGRIEVDSLDAFVEAIRSIRTTTGAAIQLFDARYVVSLAHLERAVERAERTFERDEQVARDRAVEVLLYAAGRRQIDRALRMGLSEGVNQAVAVVYAPGETTDDEEADIVDLDTATARVADLFIDASEYTRTEQSAVDDHLEEMTEADRVRSFFEITDTELSATDGTIADVVTERVALLDVEK